MHIIRQLELSDIYAGYPALLNQFRPCSLHQIDKDEFDAVFHRIMDNGCIWVCEEKNTLELIGTITAHIEQKFIHNMSKYARIEDLFVLPEYRGQGIATQLLSEAVEYCKVPSHNIHKVSLTCTDELLPFYNARGFTAKLNDLSLLNC